ncbi:unnamed protein product, partial [Coregonus sp. 'balchen']
WTAVHSRRRQPVISFPSWSTVPLRPWGSSPQPDPASWTPSFMDGLPGTHVTARPSFMDVSQVPTSQPDPDSWTSPSETLKLLKMSICPHVSPAAWLDQCRDLRELALNYHLLSDELLLALSSEKHVNLEHLRIDAVSENPGQTLFHSIKKSSWDALTLFHSIKKSSWDAMVRHSPKPFFRVETPVTHLYFGWTVSKAMLGHIGLHCPRLEELVVCANGLQPLDKEMFRIVEGCTSLSAIGLGECERCGKGLTQLSIMEEVLVPGDGYSNVEQIHTEVSKHLGRMWYPDMMPTW